VGEDLVCKTTLSIEFLSKNKNKKNVKIVGARM
jgi:hypothetical protein